MQGPLQASHNAPRPPSAACSARPCRPRLPSKCRFSSAGSSRASATAQTTTAAAIADPRPGKPPVMQSSSSSHRTKRTLRQPTPPSPPTQQQKQQQQQQKQQQQQQQQQQWPHATPSRPLRQQPPAAAAAAADGAAGAPAGGSLGQLSSAVDKLYRQRLREVKALLSPAALQQLTQEMSPEQVASLQLVLEDLQDLQGSWEEADEALDEAEQQLVSQLAASGATMPDDFSSYLMSMLPEGSGASELQQLLAGLDDSVLAALQSVYLDLKEFEQADLDLAQAQQRYVELSSRMSAVAEQVQQALAAAAGSPQQQGGRQYGEQQQQQQQQQLVFGRLSSTAAEGGGRALPTPQQVRQILALEEEDSGFNGRTESFGSGSSSSSSSSGGSRPWGAAWAKPRLGKSQQATNPNSSRLSASSSSSSSVGAMRRSANGPSSPEEVWHTEAAPLLPVQRADQQEGHSSQGGMPAEAGAVPPARQRRRRTAIRRTKDHPVQLPHELG